MNKTADIKTDGTDVIVVSDGKEVFRKRKTDQTVAVANDIYMYHKYKDGR